MNRFVFFFVFLLLISCFISFVGLGSASDDYLVSNAEGTTYYADIYTVAPLAHGGYALTFISSQEGYLSRIDVYLRALDEPNFLLSCILCSVVGDNLTGNVYADAPLAQATNKLNSTTMSQLDSWYSFSFNHTYLLEEDGVYALVLLVYESDFVSGGAGDLIRWRSAANLPNYYKEGLGDWLFAGGGATLDFTHRVYLNVESSVMPTPSPSPSVVPQYPMPDPFVSVPSYYMVLLVLFAVVAVLAGLYVTFEREQSNKGVALLFVLVGLVVFVVLIVGYFVGF